MFLWFFIFYSADLAVIFLCLYRTLRTQMLSRLLSKLELGLTRATMDLDYMEFSCMQELYLCNALPPTHRRADRDICPAGAL